MAIFEALQNIIIAIIGVIIFLAIAYIITLFDAIRDRNWKWALLLIVSIPLTILPVSFIFLLPLGVLVLYWLFGNKR